MILCESCNDWLHFKCANLTKEESELIQTFICQPCLQWYKHRQEILYHNSVQVKALDLINMITPKQPLRNTLLDLIITHVILEKSIRLIEKNNDEDESINLLIKNCWPTSLFRISDKPCFRDLSSGSNRRKTSTLTV